MKTKLLVSFIFISLSLKAQINELLPTEQRVRTHIFLEKNNHFKEAVEAELLDISKDSLLKLCVKSAIEGKVQVYEPFTFTAYDFQNEALKPEDVKIRMGGGNDTVYIDDGYSDELTQVVVENEINYEELKSLVFVDSWYFNSGKMSFEKEVKAYTPVRKFYKEYDIDYEEPKYKKICTFSFQNLNKRQKRRAARRAEHFFTLQYEHSFFNYFEKPNYKEKIRQKAKDITWQYNFFENREAPYFTSVTRSFLVSKLLNFALSGKNVVYYPESQKRILPAEIKQRLGAGNDTIVILNPSDGEPMTQIIKNEINPEEIKSLIFIEDWLLDPKTFLIIKKIRSIIPVRHYYKSDDIEETEPIKKMVFEMKF